jgi:hypothetical protein
MLGSEMGMLGRDVLIKFVLVCVPLAASRTLLRPDHLAPFSSVYVCVLV